MNYNVDYDSLFSMHNIISSQYDAWIKELDHLKSKFEVLINTSNMSGSGADNIKNYIESIHLMIIELLNKVIVTHYANCTLYTNDYHKNIDTGLHSVIKSSELHDLSAHYRSTKTEATNVEESLVYVLNGIRDIYSVSYQDVSYVDEAHRRTVAFLEDLDEKINSLELNHSQNDFLNTNNLINLLKSFISEQSTNNRNYMEDFTIEKLYSSTSFLNLYNSYVKITKELDEKADVINEAIDNENERLIKLQEEYEERQKVANAVNIVITGAVIIASVAVIATTGGAATPLVVGSVSAISGAVIAGTSNLSSQYIVHGNIIENADNIDWVGLGKDIVVSGIAGFITGYIGAGVSKAATTWLSTTTYGSTMLNSSSTFVRVSTGAVIGSASEVGSGILSRGTATFLTSGGSIDETLDSAINVKNIVYDVALGGISGGIAAAKNPVGKEIKLDELDKETLKTKPKYSPDPKKWINEQGGKIYVDGNNIWTYEAADGVHVCYYDGTPDFKRAGLGKTEVDIGTFDDNRSSDFNKANKIHVKKPTETWHHQSDGHTLLAVDTKYHDLFRHRGGFSIVNGGK